MYSVQENTSIWHKLSRTVLFAVIGMTLTLMLSLVFAMLISCGAFDCSKTALSGLCCIPGGIFCGFMSARCAGNHMLVWGAVSGAVFLALLLSINALFLPALCSSGFAAVLVSGMGGSLIGAILHAMLKK